MQKNKLLPFTILVLFVATICFILVHNGAYQKLATRNIHSVTLGGVKLKVDLAITREEQQQGLSGRSALAPDAGMLFVFAKSGKYYFWMKDMNFAIDMLWISEDGRVLYIKKDARPEEYLKTFGPDEDAKYVLEVVSGFSNKNGIKVGDIVQFSY